MTITSGEESMVKFPSLKSRLTKYLQLDPLIQGKRK